MSKPHLSIPATWNIAAGDVETANRAASKTDFAVVAWRPQKGSADAQLLPDLGDMVARARDIDRNNGVARGARQTLIDNVIGTGPRLSMRPKWKTLKKSKEWAEELAANFETLHQAWWWSTACDAADRLTGDQLTALQFGQIISAGECTGLPLWIDDRGDGFATKIQTVDPDRLSTPPGVLESTTLRAGIRFGQYGEPLGYYFRKTHENDYATSVGDAFGWEYVPRYTGFRRLRVLHGFDPDRPAQSRGRPFLATILPQFKQIDRYTNAEIMAAVVNAMLALVIQTPMDHEQVMEFFNGDPKAYQAARSEHAVGLENGTAISLFPGDTATSFLPQRPASGFGAFVENVYRIAGVGLDLPYELLMKDFSKTNYSSARAALLEAWRSFKRRRQLMCTQWLDPCARLFLEECISAGKIPGVTLTEYYANRWAFDSWEWIGPGRGWIDPLKEIQAAKGRIDAGISTLENEAAEQGDDWRAIMEQRATEIEYAKKLGHPELAAMPTVKAPPGIGPDGKPIDPTKGDPEEEDDPPGGKPKPKPGSSGDAIAA